MIHYNIDWYLVIYEKRLINSGLIWWTNHKLYKHIKVGADDDHLNTSHAINISISIQNIVTCLMHIKSVTIGNHWHSSSLKVHVFIINEHMPTPNCSSILSSVSLNINLHILSHWTNARFWPVIWIESLFLLYHITVDYIIIIYFKILKLKYLHNLTFPTCCEISIAIHDKSYIIGFNE